MPQDPMEIEEWMCTVSGGRSIGPYSLIDLWRQFKAGDLPESASVTADVGDGVTMGLGMALRSNRDALYVATRDPDLAPRNVDILALRSQGQNVPGASEEVTARDRYLRTAHWGHMVKPGAVDIQHRPIGSDIDTGVARPLPYDGSPLDPQEKASCQWPFGNSHAAPRKPVPCATQDAGPSCASDPQERLREFLKAKFGEPQSPQAPTLSPIASIGGTTKQGDISGTAPPAPAKPLAAPHSCPTETLFTAPEDDLGEDLPPLGSLHNQGGVSPFATRAVQDGEHGMLDDLEPEALPPLGSLAATESNSMQGVGSHHGPEGGLLGHVSNAANNTILGWRESAASGDITGRPVGSGPAAGLRETRPAAVALNSSRMTGDATGQRMAVRSGSSLAPQKSGALVTGEFPSKNIQTEKRKLKLERQMLQTAAALPGFVSLPKTLQSDLSDPKAPGVGPPMGRKRSSGNAQGLCDLPAANKRRLESPPVTSRGGINGVAQANVHEKAPFHPLYGASLGEALIIPDDDVLEDVVLADLCDGKDVFGTDAAAGRRDGHSGDRVSEEARAAAMKVVGNLVKEHGSASEQSVSAVSATAMKVVDNLRLMEEEGERLGSGGPAQRDGGPVALCPVSGNNTMTIKRRILVSKAVVDDPVQEGSAGKKARRDSGGGTRGTSSRGRGRGTSKEPIVGAKERPAEGRAIGKPKRGGAVGGKPRGVKAEGLVGNMGRGRVTKSHKAKRQVLGALLDDDDTPVAQELMEGHEVVNVVTDSDDEVVGNLCSHRGAVRDGHPGGDMGKCGKCLRMCSVLHSCPGMAQCRSTYCVSCIGFDPGACPGRSWECLDCCLTKGTRWQGAT